MHSHWIILPRAVRSTQCGASFERKMIMELHADVSIMPLRLQLWITRIRHPMWVMMDCHNGANKLRVSAACVLIVVSSAEMRRLQTTHDAAACLPHGRQQGNVLRGMTREFAIAWHNTAFIARLLVRHRCKTRRWAICEKDTDGFPENYVFFTGLNKYCC